METYQSAATHDHDDDDQELSHRHAHHGGPAGGATLHVEVPVNRWPSIERVESLPAPESLHGAGEADEDEKRRKEELRKAGAAYLARSLEQAGKGQAYDQQVHPEQRAKERRQKQVREDPEFVAFGRLLKDSLVYFYIALYLVCQASSYVLIKMSFKYMQTPAVLTFLHMLSAGAALSLACRHRVFEELQLSVSALQGSSVRMVLFASQLLCVFSALHHNSVHVVLVWTTAGGAAIEALVAAALGGGAPLTREAAMALLLGFGAGALELFFDPDKVAVGLVMLGLWSLSKATECVWKQLRIDATLGGRLSDMWLVSRIRFVADEEEQLGSSTLAFMQNVAPAVPVLLLGFVCREGEELVTHELSVPGVRVMLAACAAYAAATLCQLLLDERLTHPSSKLALRGASLIGACCIYAVEEYKTVSGVAVLLALVSVASSLLATWRQREAASASHTLLRSGA